MERGEAQIWWVGEEAVGGATVLSERDIRRVQRLVYVLHPDGPTAELITYKACNSFLAHQATHRGSLQQCSTEGYKLSLPEQKFLQACVYGESEKWELDQERGIRSMNGNHYQPTLDDLLVRYIKLLAWTTFELKPRHLAVGLGCHLYQYLPEQISALAPAVFNEHNIRRDNGYRLREIQERFPDLEIAPMPPYGARKVSTKRPTDDERQLVIDALERFPPWFTRHMKPSESILWLFANHDPTLYWRQKHALTDTACAGLEKLVRAKRTQQRSTAGDAVAHDDPRDKLEIPAFTNGGHTGGSDGGHTGGSDGGHTGSSPSNRFNPPRLSPDAIRLMKYVLEQEQSRRRHYRSGSLRVYVNGKEHVQLVAGANSCEPFRVPLRTSYVEIFGDDADGDLLLTAFLLPDPESLSGERVQLAVTCEGGQIVAFVIEPIHGETGEVTGGLVQVAYEKANASTRPRAVAAVGVPGAQEELDKVREALQAALLLWAVAQQMRSRVRAQAVYGVSVPVLGSLSEAVWPEHIDVRVVDPASQQQERLVPFTVVTPPTVTKNGHFILTLGTNERDVAGGTLLCSIEALEGVRVLFEGALQPAAGPQASQVIINVAGLPTCDEDVIIPVEQIRLSLLGSERHAS